MIKTYYLNVKEDDIPHEQRVQTIEIEPDLETFKELIDCDTITMTEVVIGDKRFDIISDDNALSEEDPVPVASDGNPDLTQGFVLHGNILVTSHDEDGNTIGIEDEDDHLLRTHTYVAYKPSQPKPFVYPHLAFKLPDYYDENSNKQ